MTDDLGNALIKRNKKTYFPNVNTGAGNQQFPLAPGVAEGQARMNQIAQTGTYKSRRDDFRNKYPQFANPSAQQNLQNFDLAQAYNTGYGAPTPTIQQGAGGPYRVAGGVAAPTGSTFPNLQRFGSNVATAARGIGAVGNFAANAFNGIFNRPRSSQPSYSSGVPAPYGINNLVPPPPLVGPAPNETMFPSGVGGSLPFPSQQPMLGTVQMANERFPGNVAPFEGNQYPTTIPSQRAFSRAGILPHPSYANTGPSRYFDF